MCLDIKEAIVLLIAAQAGDSGRNGGGSTLKTDFGCVLDLGASRGAQRRAFDTPALLLALPFIAPRNGIESVFRKDQISSPYFFISLFRVRVIIVFLLVFVLLHEVG